MHLKEHNIVIPIDTGPSNLPMVWNPSVSAEEQREIGLTFVSKLGICDLPGTSSMFQAVSPHSTTDRSESNSWEACWKDVFVPVLVLMKMQIFRVLRKNC